MQGEGMPSDAHLRRSDWALLAGYCALLFGVALVAGRPLTLHESVLPQSAREMLADGDWLVPKKGGEPWLESPPLPQWCTVAIASVFGRCDTEAIVRIGPLLVATLTVCLTAWMASAWYGRTVGLLSGLILATTCEFTRYAWLAEDEIYLCGLVTATIAWFVRIEFVGDAAPVFATLRKSVVHVFGARPWPVVAFFALLGATNLVKGLFFGTAMAAIPIAGWLLWNRDWPRISKYVWVPGWLLFGAILAAWPLAALQRYPDTMELWFYDLGGRMSGNYTEINQPLWYYPVNLLWMLAPWTVVVPFGLAATWPSAKSERNSPARFLWCWALLVPAVFSIPGGKHHHYLLHALAPWAILSATGLDAFRRWLATWPRWLVHPATGVCTIGLPLAAALAIAMAHGSLPGPGRLYYGMMATIPLAALFLTWGLHHPNARVAARTAFAALLVGYAWGHWYAGQHVDVNRYDVAALKEARDRGLERGEPLFVDLSRAPLSGFLELFYLPDGARSIHNVSFLADERTPRELLLVTHAGAAEALREYGEVEEVSRSRRPLKPRDEASRLVVYAVRLHDDLARRASSEVRVSPMQAMHRAGGPLLR
jgi:4-amino-4-deoxy-L-arabinose transferase-like glycosyltransferase